MRRIAIIGGGISGLAAAFTLEKHRRAGAPVQYAIFEASPRLGGVIHTEHIEGCVVEAGPDSFLSEKPWATALCRELGLEDQLIGSNDGERKTYILLNGRLVPMPDGLMFMVPTKILPALSSPLFSRRTKLQMMRELIHPQRTSDEDESVASFVERHFGSEVVERLADPLLAGVYGGDASRLSVRAVLPRFAEMERTQGSLTRALLSSGKRSSSTGRLFTSLKDGMQQMVDAIVSHLQPSSVQVNTPVQTLQAQNNGWLVSAGYATDEFDAIIVATSAPAAANLGLPEELRSALAAIEYTSSVTVTLAYDREVRRSLPPGFGYLLPRSEGKHMIAATFVHQKFPHRAPDDRALIRCFFGGARDPGIMQQSDYDILCLVRLNLAHTLKVTAEPLFVRVYRWKSAMAQYNVGHLEKIQNIERICGELPFLALAGNAYHGIGVPDCVRSGTEAAKQVVQKLGVPLD